MMLQGQKLIFQRFLIDCTAMSSRVKDLLLLELIITVGILLQAAGMEVNITVVGCRWGFPGRWGLRNNVAA